MPWSLLAFFVGKTSRSNGNSWADKSYQPLGVLQSNPITDCEEACTMIRCFIYLLMIDFLVLVGSISVQPSTEEKIDQKQCTTKKSCGECVGFHSACSWCKQEDFPRHFPRCDFKQTLKKRNCSHVNVISPSSSVVILKDSPLSEAGVKTGSYIQLKPQKIKLKLRPREVVSFSVEFRQAEDYPVDLYYLMDLTYSMRDDKEKLQELGDKLADTMSNLTSNFRIGFGSFVDKILLPYVNTVPSKLKNPCLDGKICVPPYGFRNHMPLSNNTKRFTHEVANANVSANLDDAEGGFDAIMQVIACKSQIDWDEKSRKIILFATDSGFHYAGDGKLGGVVVPNDETCHLDDNGYYTMSTHQDYPSLSQIRRIIKENKVILIFAVTSGQLPVYKKLSRAIEGAYVQELADDSSNIVELVRSKYGEIRSEVEIKFDRVPENVKIVTKAKCPEEKKGENTCSGLKVGTTVSFNISVELESCNKGGNSWSREMILYPAGLNEVLKIQLEMLCECDCEQEANKIKYSSKCTSRGTYECGICNCYDIYYGEECECNSTNIEELQSHLDACRMDNTSLVCSGNGECLCGKCYCTPKPNSTELVYGKYCQCDNFTCVRDEEQRMCGGFERGICDCGECICNSMWSGPDCSCTKSANDCIASNGEICSGNGKCVCGRCVCDKDNVSLTFEGQYCDECPECDAKCNEYRPCVECITWQMGELNEEDCHDNCGSLNMTTVSSLEEENTRLCKFQDSNGCSFRFTYSFTNKQIVAKIEVLEKKDCPSQQSNIYILGGVIGGIVLIGIIAVLIFKICITLKDRRDYARFLEEVNKTNWGNEENPIYKAAVSNYTNPTYGTTKGI